MGECVEKELQRNEFVYLYVQMKCVEKWMNIIFLQWAIWILVLCLMFIAMLQYDSWQQAATYSVINTSLYLFVIYGNANWLILKFYKARRYLAYTLSILLMLSIAVFIRSFVYFQIYNAWFAKTKEKFSIAIVIPASLSIIIVFIVSVIFSLAMDFFRLRKMQESIKAEKVAVELGLLKQQLHPHFLFNTLNNIYYVAQRESPIAADLIERLASIMRYFIEESPKEKVPLQNEIDLLNSYIELENLRLVNKVTIDFAMTGDTEKIKIPPLLLMPIVENIFKHGVDKKGKENIVHITLQITNDFLIFETANKQIESLHKTSYIGGVGISNLEKRLELYYGQQYELNIQNDQSHFILTMKIPTREN